MNQKEHFVDIIECTKEACAKTLDEIEKGNFGVDALITAQSGSILSAFAIRMNEVFGAPKENRALSGLEIAKQVIIPVLEEKIEKIRHDIKNIEN